MEITELKQLVIKQQEQILTLQILTQTLVDELVETGVLSDENLDIRLSEKIKLINTQMGEMRKEASMDYLKNQIFGNQMGEA